MNKQTGPKVTISFSCSNTNKLQPSLKFILKEVDKTVYNNKIITRPIKNIKKAYLGM